MDEARNMRKWRVQSWKWEASLRQLTPDRYRAAWDDVAALFDDLRRERPKMFGTTRLDHDFGEGLVARALNRGDVESLALQITNEAIQYRHRPPPRPTGIRVEKHLEEVANPLLAGLGRLAWVRDGIGRAALAYDVVIDLGGDDDSPPPHSNIEIVASHLAPPFLAPRGVLDVLAGAPRTEPTARLDLEFALPRQLCGQPCEIWCSIECPANDGYSVIPIRVAVQSSEDTQLDVAWATAPAALHRDLMPAIEEFCDLLSAPRRAEGQP